MKKWLYLIPLMLFFVANTNAANSDFFGAREVVAAKGEVGQEDVEGGQIIIQGYSYGGVLANHLSKRLKEAKLDVNLLVAVDAAAGPE